MLFSSLVPMTAVAADVVVVKSKDFVLYDKAVTGFQEVHKGSLSVIVMKGALADPGKLAGAVREQNPKAILAVGLRAAQALRAEISDIPIVFCMTMHPQQNKLFSNNSTGVDLEPTPKDQLQAFKEAIPSLNKVGIIYDPKRTGPFVEASRKVAPEVGLTLVARAVEARKDVLGALKEIVEKADALWIIRDATVLTREFFNHTLIVQYEKKIPILAYSDQFVRKGAVCSFAASYRSQGKKAAEVVQSILGGTGPGDIPLQTPEGNLTINLNSASKANVKVSPRILQRPDVKKVE